MFCVEEIAELLAKNKNIAEKRNYSSMDDN